MTSLRGRILFSIFRNRHLLSFKLHKDTGYDWETSIDEVRQTAAKGSKLLGRPPKGIDLEPLTIGNLRAEWLRLPEDQSESTILYFHGGGYVLGTIEMHRGIVAKFVKGSGMAALLFGYRLAPEHPFPAALDDALAAYQWLLDRGVSSARIAFAGDSAGGGLCLATLLAIRDRGLPLPAAAAAFSPFTDLKCEGESYQTKANRCLSPAGSWVACSRHYTGGQDPSHPYISPLYGDLHGLPPLLIYAGEDEVLFSDSERFATKAKDAGVDVTFRVGQGLFHCYPVCSPLFPEAKRAMNEICEFLRQHTDGNNGD